MMPSAALAGAAASDPVTRNLTVESTKLPRPLNREAEGAAAAGAELCARPRSQRRAALSAKTTRNLPVSGEVSSDARRLR